MTASHAVLRDFVERVFALSIVLMYAGQNRPASFAFDPSNNEMFDVKHGVRSFLRVLRKADRFSYSGQAIISTPITVQCEKEVTSGGEKSQREAGDQQTEIPQS